MTTGILVALLVVLLIALAGGDRDRLGSLVHHDQEPQHALVQLDGPLELGEGGAVGVELGDDVVAGLVLLDRIGEGPLAPVAHLGSFDAGLLDEGVEAREALVDGRLFERTIEDIDDLVLTGHDTFLRSESPRAWCGRRGGWFVRGEV